MGPCASQSQDSRQGRDPTRRFDSFRLDLFPVISLAFGVMCISIDMCAYMHSLFDAVAGRSRAVLR